MRETAGDDMALDWAAMGRSAGERVGEEPVMEYCIETGCHER